MHEHWMRRALRLAEQAAEQNEVPVGALILHDGQVIAEAWNQREQLNDPTAHAEMIAITQAAESLRSWRLQRCTLYVTLEPCPMCAGAIVQARLPLVVFGATDPKGGGVVSLYRLLGDERLNHRCRGVEGVLAEPCGAEGSQGQAYSPDVGVSRLGAGTVATNATTPLLTVPHQSDSGQAGRCVGLPVRALADSWTGIFSRSGGVQPQDATTHAARHRGRSPLGPLHGLPPTHGHNSCGHNSWTGIFLTWPLARRPARPPFGTPGSVHGRFLLVLRCLTFRRATV